MLNLYLAGGELDIYAGQSVDWTYTPIRFTEELTEPYTTDFSIPASNHNIQLLKASGLLDSDNRFNTQIKPCTMSVNGVVMNAYMQVASVTETDISVAVFEKAIPQDVMNKTIFDFKQDDRYSIWPWNKDSDIDNPSVFKRYFYGFRDANYAMYHPSKRVNSIIDIISSMSGYYLPYTNTTYWMTATNKYLCPQNTKQVIEIDFKNGQYGVVNGGQHITNDMSWSWTADNDTITFNRQCNVTMNITISYKRKLSHNQTSYFETILVSGGTTPSQDNFTLIGSTRSGITTATYTVATNYIQNNTTLQFRMQDIDDFQFVNAVVEMTFSGYDITVDDYGEDLNYIGRHPQLKVRDYNSDTDKWVIFDGSTYSYSPERGTTLSFYAKDLSFAYIGFFCNLPEIKLKDLLFGLCWLTETKFQKRKWTYYFDAANTTYTIDGTITIIETTNDAVGAKNHLLFAGEEDNATNIVSEIDSFWLESDKDIHKSPFTLYQLQKVDTKNFNCD